MRVALLFAALVLPNVALAGGYLAGGMAVTPGQVATVASGVSPYRIGGGSGPFTAWGSLNYISGKLDSEDLPLRAKLWLPQIGLRYDLGDRASDGAVPYVLASFYTAAGGVEFDGEDLIESGDFAVSLPLGGTAALGLDAPLHRHLSLSAEMGGDAFRVAVVESDTYVTAVSRVQLYAAAYVNLWF